MGLRGGHRSEIRVGELILVVFHVEDLLELELTVLLKWILIEEVAWFFIVHIDITINLDH